MRWHPNSEKYDGLTDRLHRPDRAAHLISELVVHTSEDVKRLQSEWSAEANVKAWDGTHICSGADFMAFPDGNVMLCGEATVGWDQVIDGNEFLTQLTFSGSKAQPDDVYGVRVRFTVDQTDVAHTRLTQFAPRLSRNIAGAGDDFNGTWFLHIYAAVGAPVIDPVLGQAMDLQYFKSIRYAADDMNLDEQAVPFDLAEAGLHLGALKPTRTFGAGLGMAAGAVYELYFVVEAVPGRDDGDAIVGEDNVGWVTQGSAGWAFLDEADGAIEWEHFTKRNDGYWNATPAASLEDADFTFGSPARMYFTVARLQYPDPAAYKIMELDLDLGAAPASDTDLEIRFEDSRPAGTESICEISSNSGANWYACDDGDLIGIADNPSGNDLSAVARQQTYLIRWKAKSNTATAMDRSITPILREIGVVEHKSFDVTDMITYRSLNGWRVDPLTLEATVGEVLVDVVRDGQRDFQDLVSRIVTENPFNNIELRLYVGHEDLPRNEWGFIERLLVDDLKPLTDGTQFRAVSVLEQVKGRVPLADFVSGERPPISYVGVGIKTVVDDLLDGEIGIPARFRGNVTDNDTTTVTKTLVNNDGLKELSALAFIDGKAMIASQGRVKGVNVHEGDRPLVAVWRIDEAEVVDFDPGFRRRQPEYFVRFGFNEREHNDFVGEVRDFNAAALAALSRARIEEAPLRAPREVEMWLDWDDSLSTPSGIPTGDKTTGSIPYSTAAAEIARRIPEKFGTGMHLMAIQTQHPHPWIEIGDLVAIEQDVLVLRDPVTDKELRGRAFVPGTVIEQYDFDGTQFLVWVESLSDIISSRDGIDLPGQGEVFVWAELRRDATQPSNAKYGLHAFPKTGTTIYWIYQDEADDVPGRTQDGSGGWTSASPGDEVVHARDASLAKRMSLYGVRNGRMGPMATVVVAADERAEILDSSVLQTGAGSGGNASVKRSVDVDSHTTRVKVYRRLDNWPTLDDSQGGNLDALYYKGWIDSDDSWSYENFGYGTGDVVYDIFVPVNADNSPGMREEYSYTVLSGDPVDPVITSMSRVQTAQGTGCDAADRRKITVTWATDNAADGPQDMEIYVRVDGGSWVLDFTEASPVSNTSYVFTSIYTYGAAGAARTEDFKLELVTSAVTEDTATRNDEDNFTGLPCPV